MEPGIMTMSELFEKESKWLEEFNRALDLVFGPRKTDCPECGNKTENYHCACQQRGL